jgi:hypothetical protein
MSCLICLDDLNKDTVRSEKCSCRLEYHVDCYNNFINKSKFFCPICRIVDKKINILNDRFNNPSSVLFYYVFKLPAPLAVCTWFIFSLLFFIFVCPILLLYYIVDYYKLNTIMD